jgi:hypothetical protein
MSTEADIMDKLARSLKPFWHYTQNDVIGEAMAEITNLRAERDAWKLAAQESLRISVYAASDMQKQCAKVADEYDSDNANDISERIRALPTSVIATERGSK